MEAGLTGAQGAGASASGPSSLCYRAPGCRWSRPVAVVSMLWLIAQLVISSLPQAYPTTLETLNWCAPALGFVLAVLAVLWMVFLRHYITGPEPGESQVPAWLTLSLPGAAPSRLTKCSRRNWPLQVPQMSCTSVHDSPPSVAAEFTNSDLLKTW